MGKMTFKNTSQVCFFFSLESPKVIKENQTQSSEFESRGKKVGFI